MTDTRTRVVCDPEELESLSTLWNSLLEDSVDRNSIHLTHEWVSAWWKHFGHGRRLNVVLVETEVEVIGLFPLMRSEYRIGLARLRVLETIGAVSCNYLGIVPSRHKMEAVAAFAGYLERGLREEGIVLKLDYIPDDCELADALRERLDSLRETLFCDEAFAVRAPYMSLPATWDECFRSLGRNMRKHLPRKNRRLEEKHDVWFEQPAAEELDDRLREFFKLHQRRWQSVHIGSAFKDLRMRDFYADITRRFSERGWLHFSYLVVDGSMASAVHGFIYRGVFYFSTIARDVSLSKYGIGHLHIMHLVKHGIANGLSEIDMLAGQDPYKFLWTKTFRSCTQILAAKRGMGASLRVKLARRFLRVHRIRQYGVREIVPRYRIMKRMERDLRDMGLQSPK